MTKGGGMADHVSSREQEQAQQQAVKVAVHVRPLIPEEVLQGCKDCIRIPPGEPQVQIGNFRFTFDHVFGGSALPSSRIFQDCVVPLVDDLFNGYNATVLAYGQTGSGKTYTMGTSYTAVGSDADSIIPQVMDLIFAKIGTCRGRVEYRLRVSFIEILNEEVYDLLDLSSSIVARPEMYVGAFTRPATSVKPSVQIRETLTGGITLVGATEIEVHSLREMVALLQRGAASRATGSTNMNLQSSRSHAIFTVILQQRRESLNCNTLSVDNFCDDLLSAKLHLVDLAGSERVKRTRTDGIRFKEGVNINRGLLALGNVISALGDEKRRKDGAHVPYRDSKLTRLLQDSLGGNSRTLMIACISPADSNAEETLNTLKYANRARNIQNKPIINRDPVSAEINHMRRQLELLQAELLCIRAGGGPFDEIHALKQRLAWVEGSNADLRQELQQARDSLQFCAKRVMDVMIERDDLRHKLDLLQSGKTWIGVNHCDGCQTSCCFSDKVGKLHSYPIKVQDLESHIDQMRIPDSEYSGLSSQTVFNRHADCSDEHSLDLQVNSQGFGHVIPHLNEEENEAIAKELEHTRLHDSMNKELQDLTERLKQKEDEMMMIMKRDSAVLKLQFEKKLKELEDEKMLLQEEKDKLLQDIKDLASISEGQTQRIQEAHAEKLKDLEIQLAGLKEKQTQLLKQNLTSDGTIKTLQDEILRMKSQKVQLQQRIKHESESLRSWKATREKELLQLRKETRKNEHEMRKLQALNQRQKMVLQRKTEEAAMATRRLKDVLESRKLSAPDIFNRPKSATQKVKQVNLKSLEQSLERELEVSVHIHEVRSNYEKQAELRASLAREMESLKQEEKMQHKLEIGSQSPSVSVRKERSALLQSLLDTSSRALVAMGSELSDVEERQSSFSGPGFLQHLESVEDAKALLQHLFNMAVEFRCQLSDKNIENKELKENIGNISELLKQSQAKRRDDHQVQQLQKHAIAKAIATSSQAGSGFLISQGMEDLSISPSQPKNFKAQELYPHNLDLFGLLNLEAQNSFSKAVDKPKEIWVGSKISKAPQSRKKRLKRSHDQWRLHFKWSWQKPWRLSEWIRHGDESLHARSPNLIIDIV